MSTDCGSYLDLNLNQNNHEAAERPMQHIENVCMIFSCPEQETASTNNIISQLKLVLTSQT